MSEHKENVDDAGLIAAAPEMLESLEALVRKFDKYGFAFTDEWFMSWIKNAKVAIIKAKGTT